MALSVLEMGASDWLIGVPIIFKLHIVLGLIIIFISPFTRLVHVWSAPIWFHAAAEDWATLTSRLHATDDPGRACLVTMMKWRLAATGISRRPTEI